MGKAEFAAESNSSSDRAILFRVQNLIFFLEG